MIFPPPTLKSERCRRHNVVKVTRGKLFIKVGLSKASAGADRALMYAVDDAQQTAQICLPIKPQRPRITHLRQNDGGDLNYTDL